MNDHDQNRPEGVHDRRFNFCHRLRSEFDTDQLFQHCNECNRFFARCSGECPHGSHQNEPQLQPSLQAPSVCHHWPVVFTDGVCNSSTIEARGGLGFALGTDAEDQLSMRVDSEGLGFGGAAAQTTVLLAAILALRDFAERGLDRASCAVGRDVNFNGSVELVVATDSVYVARGITQWYPSWRRNNWKNVAGRTPANLDMFFLLEEAICRLEALGVAVGFIYISRQHNALANRLARDGANRTSIDEE